MSNTFKISGVGIDTTRINDTRYSTFNDFTYIHTTPRAGNEFYIKRAEFSDDQVLITSVDFLDQIENVIVNHLHELGRDNIDILLIDSKCKIEDNIDTINNLIISGLVSEVGISNPESIKRLDELKNIISPLSYISLDICPLNFEWSVIKYCNENNIKIFGFNPLGGKINYPRLIESFTIPYLLAFSAVYSDIVFLSSCSDNIYSENAYLMELINKEYNKKAFEMSQDVNKLLKEPKKTIHTSLKLDDGSIIPYDSGYMIFSYPELSFSIGKSKPVFPDINEETTDNLINLVYNFYKGFSGGPIDNPSPENTMMLLRYRILDLAKLEYPEIDGWSIFITPIDQLTFVLSGARKSIEKKFWKTKKIVEQFSYIAFYNGTDLIFRNLRNALGTE